MFLATRGPAAAGGCRLFLPRLVEAIEARGVSTQLRPGLENPLPGSEEPLHEEACIVVPTNNTPSYAIAEEDPFLAEVRSIAVFHEPLGANFGTEAWRLAPLGCRSVILGPGDIAEAHRPDVDLDSRTDPRERCSSDWFDRSCSTDRRPTRPSPARRLDTRTSEVSRSESRGSRGASRGIAETARPRGWSSSGLEVLVYPSARPRLGRTIGELTPPPRASARPRRPAATPRRGTSRSPAGRAASGPPR